MKSASLITHALLFIVSFSIEITVHASAIMEPRNCLNTKAVCAIENPSVEPLEIKVGSSILTLDHDTTLVRTTDSHVRLVKGTLWVRATPEMTVSAEFGDAQATTSSEFWITRSKDSMTVSTVLGAVEISGRGTNEKLIVTAGLQNTLGSVNLAGQSSTGLPMPIPFKELVTRWAKFYRGPKKDFLAQVDAFHTVWVDASKESAEINRTLYSRKVASVESLKRAAAEKSAKANAEKRELHELYLRRVFDGL